MLEANGLSFRYGKPDPWVFRDISFSLAPGEVVGLPGASGAGKTTLARVLCGFLSPAAGNIMIDGRPIRKNGAHPVQMIFQHPELAVNPHWKVSKILNEGHPVSRGLCDTFGIEGAWLDRYPWELSGGQLARICIARALGPGTRFLVVDEITAMLDAVTQARIWKSLLTHIRTNGIGMVVISHDPYLIDRTCDRTAKFF